MALTIQPLSVLFQQADQMREVLNLARQKVEMATSQSAFGNGVPTLGSVTEALSAFGIIATIAIAAALGGYFVYRRMKHRRIAEEEISA